MLPSLESRSKLELNLLFRFPFNSPAWLRLFLAMFIKLDDSCGFCGLCCLRSVISSCRRPIWEFLFSTCTFRSCNWICSSSRSYFSLYFDPAFIFRSLFHASSWHFFLLWRKMRWIPIILLNVFVLSWFDLNFAQPLFFLQVNIFFNTWIMMFPLD